MKSKPYNFGADTGQQNVIVFMSRCFLLNEHVVNLLKERCPLFIVGDINQAGRPLVHACSVDQFRVSCLLHFLTKFYLNVQLY